MEYCTKCVKDFLCRDKPVSKILLGLWWVQHCREGPAGPVPTDLAQRDTAFERSLVSTCHELMMSSEAFSS